MKNNKYDKIRAFNRYYTVLLGLLDKHILDSEYSLIEARIIFEINHYQTITASQIINLLKIDKGYLSRILKRFEIDGVINKTISESDKRIINISLTDFGSSQYRYLNDSTNKQINTIFGSLPIDRYQIIENNLESVMKILQASLKE